LRKQVEVRLHIISRSKPCTDLMYQEWDTSREKNGDALDTVLESLGSQLVPPEFYDSSSDSSLFGSQHGLDEDVNAIYKGLFSESTGTPTSGLLSPVSPSSTLKRRDLLSPKPSRASGLDIDFKSKGKHPERRSRNADNDRRSWKTLRDFVDDKSIDDTLDIIENDRRALDVSIYFPSCNLRL